MQEKTAEEILRDLSKQYKDNDDAIDTINRAKADIEYLKEKEKEKGYTGQTALQHALEIQYNLEYWN